MKIKTLAVRLFRTILSPAVGFWLMLNYIAAVWEGDFDGKEDTFGDNL